MSKLMNVFAAQQKSMEAWHKSEQYCPPISSQDTEASAIDRIQAAISAGEFGVPMTLKACELHASLVKTLKDLGYKFNLCGFSNTYMISWSPYSETPIQFMYKLESK